MASERLLLLGAMVAWMRMTEAQTVNCYSCSYSTNPSLGPTTCANDFNPTGIPTCPGTNCLTINTTSGNDYYVNRTCNSQAPMGVSSGSCSMMAYYIGVSTSYSGDQCCGSSGNMAACACAVDYCNDYPLAPPVPPTTIPPTTTLGTQPNSPTAAGTNQTYESAGSDFGTMIESNSTTQPTTSSSSTKPPTTTRKTTTQSTTMITQSVASSTDAGHQSTAPATQPMNSPKSGKSSGSQSRVAMLAYIRMTAGGLFFMLWLYG